MKRALIGLAALGLLVVAILAALPMFVSTQWVRETVISQISQATGLTISIDGAVSLRALPTLSLSADAVRVRAPDGADVMSLSTLRADLSLIPLLTGTVNVNEIVLDGLHIALQRLEDGSITLPGLSHRTASTGTAAGDADSDPLAILERLSVAHFNVRNGVVVIEDVASGVRETADKVFVELRLPGIAETAHAEGNLVFRGAPLAFSADIDTPQTLSNTAPTAVTIAVSEGPATGEITGTAILGSTLSFDGTVALASDNLSDAIAWASGSAPGVTLGAMSLKATAVMNPLALALTNIAGKLNDTAFTGELTLPTATEVPQVRGRIAADTIDLASFQSDDQADTANAPAADTPIDLAGLKSVDAEVAVSVEELRAPNLTLKGLTAQVSLQNGMLQVEVPQVGFGGGSIGFIARAWDDNGTAAIDGRATVAQLPLATVLAFAPAPYDASGMLFADVGFTSRGATTDTLTRNATAEGSIGLRDGRVTGLPLAQAVPGDSAAGTLDAINVDARFAGTDSPVSLSGNVRWRSDTFAVTGTSGPPGVLLSGAPSNLNADLRSPRVATSFAGTITLGGQANGRVGLSTPSLRGLLAWLDNPIGEGDGLQATSIEGVLTATATGVALSDAVISIDQSSARGAGSVALGGTRPSVKADLAFDTLNLTPYLAGGSAPQPSGNGIGWSRDPLDLTVLKALDASVSLTATSIVVDELKTGAATLGVTLNDGRLEALLSRFELYSGSGTGRVTLIDDRGATTSAEFTLDGVDVHRLFKDAAGFGALAGTGKLALNTSGAGESVYGLIDSLDGSAALEIRDGAILGINIPQMMRSLSGSILSGWQTDVNEKTDFTAFGATFQIADGVATTSDLSLVGPLVRMSGTGNADLADKTLSFRVDPRIVASLEGQGSEAETKGLGVPIIIEGAWSNPRIYPDIKGILQNPQAALEQLKSLGNLGDLANSGQLGGAADVVGKLATGDTQGAIGSLIDQQIGKLGSDAAGSGGGGLQQALTSAVQQQLGGGQPAAGSGGSTQDMIGSAIGQIAGGLVGGNAQPAPQPVPTTEVPAAEAPPAAEALPPPAPTPAPAPDANQIVTGMIGSLLGQQSTASAPVQAQPQQPQPQQPQPTTNQMLGGLVGGLLGQAAGQNGQAGNAAALIGSLTGQQPQPAPQAAPQPAAPGVGSTTVIPRPNPRR